MPDAAKANEPRRKLARMTADEINQLAEGIVTGHVFTDRHCRSDAEVRTAFLILDFCGPDAVPDDAGMIWEELSKAGPVSVNGLPSFLSMRMVHTDDVPLVLEKVKAMREALDAAKAANAR